MPIFNGFGLNYGIINVSSKFHHFEFWDFEWYLIGQISILIQEGTL